VAKPFSVFFCSDVRSSLLLRILQFAAFIQREKRLHFPGKAGHLHESHRTLFGEKPMPSERVLA
ncbi:MAG: hypothetical protein WBW88_14640, partial [Rhodothermales bacterium]